MDRSAARHFTRKEATDLIGKAIMVHGQKTIVTDTFCDGPNKYLLIDDTGETIFKSHNHCPYMESIVTV